MTEPTHPTVRIFGSYAKALVVTADRIPLVGETLIGRGYRETYGGKGSDMAVQAARLGAAVDYVGVVGNDTFGREFADLMAAEGVRTEHLRTVDGIPTGVGLIVKDEAGHNIIVVDKGANDDFGRGDVDAACAASEPFAVALAQLEIPIETALYGLGRARAAGSTTILNPAPATDLRGQDLSSVDLLTPNETEARILVGRDPDDPIDLDTLAAELLALGVRTVVITLGEAGARLVEQAPNGDLVATSVPAWPVEVVDSNGAGDSFNAGLAVGLAEGRSLVDAATFAGAVAGLCCQEWETVPSYQDRATVDRFMTEKSEGALA